MRTSTIRQTGNFDKLRVNKIFNVTTNKQKVICPPEQVFVRRDFDCLLTISRDLIDNEVEYNKLRTTLGSIGETEIYILENLGATVTDRNEPFRITIKLTDNFKDFQEKVRAFVAPSGWSINHFFVYGKNESWGIYLAEFPTINIIGCDRQLSDKFRHVFSISGNGYAELKEFIAREFQSNPDQLENFITNYKLEDKNWFWKKAQTVNTTFASDRATYKLGALYFYWTLVINRDFVLRNPPDCKAQNR